MQGLYADIGTDIDAYVIISDELRPYTREFRFKIIAQNLEIRILFPLFHKSCTFLDQA